MALSMIRSRLCRMLTVYMLVTTALAHPTLRLRDFPAWTAPGPGDVRSPCPGLNALANHNILPHSGTGISFTDTIAILKQYYNIDADFATFLTSGAVLASSDPLSGTFDLDDIDTHDLIEHDASLSRQDAYLGNNTAYNQTIFSSVLAFYDGMEIATIPIASEARYSRVLDSRARNPDYTMDPNHLLISYGNSALYLNVMGSDPTAGTAPVDYVKIFFEEERLPYAEGWRTPTNSIDIATVVDMISRLYASSPDPGTELIGSITPGTLRLAYGVTDILKQKLGSLYCTTLAALCS